MKPRFLLLIFALVIVVSGLTIYLYLEKAAVHEVPVLVRDSTELKDTIIVPTLDSPITSGKSAIWGAAFQVAWDAFRTKIANQKGKPEESVNSVVRLDNATLDKNILNSELFYADVGLVKEGFIATLDEAMRSRFPNQQLPPFRDQADAILFAFMEIVIAYDEAFVENEIEFKSANGGNKKVRAFGTIESKGRKSLDSKKMRDQVEMLFLEGEVTRNPQFAIDLCRKTTQYQIIIASIPRKETLQETVKSFEKKVKDWHQNSRAFNPDSALIDFRIPMMNWDLRHRFSDLEGRSLGDAKAKGQLLLDASQRIRLQLHHQGELQESDGSIAKTSFQESLMFKVDHPYLMLIRKRGVEMPFFAMWVDNSELMIPVK